MKVDSSLIAKTDQPRQPYAPERIGSQSKGRLLSVYEQKEQAIFFASRAFSYQHVLAAILILATILRVVSAIMYGDAVTGLPGVYDQISYHRLAQRVMADYGFSFASEWWPITRAGEPTAHWSFLYTLYMVAVYTLFGVQPLVARLIQAVIGGLLHSWLVWRIGRRLFGPTVGLVAAAGSAVYLYFVYYAGALITETFYMIGILWTFDVALRLAAMAHKPDTDKAQPPQRWQIWLELGVAISITALLRQLFLLFVPFLFLWLWWNTTERPGVANGWRRFIPRFNWPALQGLALTTFVIALFIIPWTVRNYRAFGTLTPLNTNAGYAFFWGNHPIYGANFVGILPREGPEYQDLIPVELRHLNEAALDQALLKVGIGFVVDDPARYVLLSLSRTREYFKFWPSAESSMLSNLARVGSFGVFLPFMLYGLWVAGKRAWQGDAQRQAGAVLLLGLFMIIYTAIHLLTWALIRYRLPVDAVLLIFAAVGIVQIGNDYRAMKSKKLLEKQCEPVILKE